MASQALRQGVALLGVSVVLATIAMHISQEHRLELVDISAPGYYVTTGNLGAHDVQKPVKRPVVTFGQSPYRIYFDNEKRRTKREPVHDMGRDNELDVRPHRAVPEITFDKEAIKTTRNSASQATIEKWKNYKQKKEAEKLVDPCTNPGSMCSLIKHLNSVSFPPLRFSSLLSADPLEQEHLGGVISTGGEGWTPGAE
eukprot:3264261-Rhodomonas_salina.1